MHILNDRRNEGGQVTREKDLPGSRQAQLLRSTEQENPEARTKGSDQRTLKHLGAKKAS